MGKGIVPLNSTGGIDLLLDLVSKHKVSIQKILNADSRCLDACDMQYFPKAYWGRVPSYPKFRKMLTPEMIVELDELEARELGNYYEQGLRDIYERPTGEMDGSEGKRFGWGEKLYKIQERKLDRLDKKIKDIKEDRREDLMMKLINRLSNDKLEETKNVMEAVWEEVGDE